MKNQKISQCKILTVSGGYLVWDTRACTALYHSSIEWLPCLKLVSRANLALISLVCGLQKSSNLAHMTSKLRSSGSQHHDIYWSIPKSPLHAMTFLHFLESGNMASLQSNMFSHFNFHLRNLWYKLSFTVQSIFGPSIYGIIMGCTKGCGWLVDGWINCGLWTSISTSHLEDSCETIEVSWQTLVLTTQAEFFVDLGISGLGIFILRPLLSRFNNYKSRMQGTNTVKSKPALYNSKQRWLSMWNSSLDSG